jgi:hypothetical protein
MGFSAVSGKSGKTYHLHSKEVTLKGDRKQRIYYFAGVAGEFAIDALPEGYEVSENSRTGLPILRKKR